MEAAVTPEAGSSVRLVRGELVAEGRVVWAAKGRCGIRFSGSVEPQQWLSPLRNNEQQRVDQIVQLVKAGAVPLPVADFANRRTLHDSNSPSELAAHLGSACALIAKLEDRLASDPEVIARHTAVLQNLDIALQLITAVASSVAGELPQSTLKDLRRSADQALYSNSHQRLEH